LKIKKTNNKNITIIIPVYKDRKTLNLCLESLKKCVSSDVKIILINDRSPEYLTMEKNILRSIKNYPNFHYYLNEENMGFLKTCNKAVFEIDKTENDVLFLNSDTKVTRNFLENMREVLYKKEEIAVVCPRTNNAFYLSFPISKDEKSNLSPKKSYYFYKKYRSYFPRYQIIPTAIGFCMLIKREVINKLGLFDEIYDKGYQEENDFSQRAIKNGFLIAVSHKSFVFHYVGKSFNEETKKNLNERNYRILLERYPNFNREVGRYYDSLSPVDYYSKILTNYPDQKIVFCLYKLKINLIKKIIPLIDSLILELKLENKIYIMIDKKNDDYLRLSKKYRNIIFEDYKTPDFFYGIIFSDYADNRSLFLMNRISLKFVGVFLRGLLKTSKMRFLERRKRFLSPLRALSGKNRRFLETPLKNKKNRISPRLFSYDIFSKTIEEAFLKIRKNMMKGIQKNSFGPRKKIGEGGKNIPNIPKKDLNNIFIRYNKIKKLGIKNIKLKRANIFIRILRFLFPN